MADLLVQEGYADVGYEYVNVDDCWFVVIFFITKVAMKFRASHKFVQIYNLTSGLDLKFI